MRVGINFVQWRYDIRYNKVKGHEEIVTTCRIVDYASKEEISSAEIKLHVNDKMNYDTARKVSLSRALITLPKEQRSEYWEAYRTLTAKPRWLSVAERKALKAQKLAKKAARV